VGITKLYRLLTWGLLLASMTTYAQTIEVCSSCEVRSIKDAIRQATPHSTILVKGGAYHEGNIIIDKPLRLIGEGLPILDGDHKNEILTIAADSVMIDGFQIQNVGTSYIKDQAGINVVKKDYCTIQNNRLINTFFGIYLQKSQHSKILNNEVFGEAQEEMSSGNAIHLWHCQHIEIKDNHVKNHRDGIYLEFVDDSRIANNLSEGQLRYGLHFMFSNNDDYINNVFRDNGAGVAVMFSRGIKMKENIFEKNWGASSYGLLLKEIYDGEITNNKFIENTIGIYGESATRNHIAHNDFIRNGWAFKVLGSCMDNTITANNFMGNTFDIATNSSRNYNNFDGNYWSEYAGYDLDRDGIGDVPHRPVKLFSYVVTRVDTSIILLRSMFIDIINFAEKVTPMFTPAALLDNTPRMKPLSTL
jgi:nitrous oxidase accessory protein